MDDRSKNPARGRSDNNDKSNTSMFKESENCRRDLRVKNMDSSCSETISDKIEYATNQFSGIARKSRDDEVASNALYRIIEEVKDSEGDLQYEQRPSHNGNDRDHCYEAGLQGELHRDFSEADGCQLKNLLPESGKVRLHSTPKATHDEMIEAKNRERDMRRFGGKCTVRDLRNMDHEVSSTLSHTVRNKCQAREYRKFLNVMPTTVSSPPPWDGQIHSQSTNPAIGIVQADSTSRAFTPESAAFVSGRSSFDQLVETKQSTSENRHQLEKAIPSHSGVEQVLSQPKLKNESKKNDLPNASSNNSIKSGGCHLHGQICHTTRRPPCDDGSVSENQETGSVAQAAQAEQVMGPAKLLGISLVELAEAKRQECERGPQLFQGYNVARRPSRHRIQAPKDGPTKSFEKKAGRQEYVNDLTNTRHSAAAISTEERNRNEGLYGAYPDHLQLPIKDFTQTKRTATPYGMLHSKVQTESFSEASGVDCKSTSTVDSKGPVHLYSSGVDVNNDAATMVQRRVAKLSDSKRRESDACQSLVSGATATRKPPTSSRHGPLSEMASACNEQTQQIPSVAALLDSFNSALPNRAKMDPKNIVERIELETQRLPESVLETRLSSVPGETDELARAKKLERERGPQLPGISVGAFHCAASSKPTHLTSDRRYKSTNANEFAAMWSKNIVPTRLEGKQMQAQMYNGELQLSAAAHGECFSSSYKEHTLETLRRRPEPIAHVPARFERERSKRCEQNQGPSLSTPLTTHSNNIDCQNLEQSGNNFASSQTGGIDSGAESSDCACHRDGILGHNSSTEFDGIEDGVLMFPGAYAIEGVRVSNDEDSRSDYDSDCDNCSYDSRFNSTDIPCPVDESTELRFMEDDVLEGGVLEAALHEELIVDGAIILPGDDDENLLDIKTVQRMRMVQIFSVCFCLVAIVLVCTSVAGRFSEEARTKRLEDTPSVEGWYSVGVNVFVPGDQPQALFGSQVVLSKSGTRMAVVAPGINNDATKVGAIFIMEQSTALNGTEWKVLEIINGSDSNSGSDMSLSTSGNMSIVVAGFPHFQGGGRIQIFEERRGRWLEASTPARDPSLRNRTTEAWFGYSVDLASDGSMLAVGAPLMDGMDQRRIGAVFVYEKRNSIDGQWDQLGEAIFGKETNECFGYSVQIARSSKGIQLVVGAPISNETTGLIRTFDWTGSKWVQNGRDVIGSEGFQRFGESLSLSSHGTVLAVGGRGSALNPGLVKIYRKNSTAWVSSAAGDIIVGLGAGEGFGTAVSLSDDGNILAVGAPQSNLYGLETGTVRIYQFDADSGIWIEQGKNIGNELIHDFGTSVSLSSDGTKFAGGAPLSALDASVPRVGCVQVYSTSENTID